MQFLTFGGGPNQGLHAAVRRLCEQARQFDMFDEIHGLTEVDLQKNPAFWADHGEWIEQCISRGVMRGYGYWVWKFYLIGKILGGMPEGHLLLYLDCGCELNVQGKEKMAHYCNLAHQHKLIGTSTNSNDLSHTKRDLVHFVLGNLEDPVLAKPHMQSGILLMENCAEIRKLFQHAQSCMKHYHLVDDSSSVAENHPSFVEHRHDQSVLNLLVKQKGLHNHLLDPSYFAPDWNQDGADYPIWAPRNKTGQSIITPSVTWYVQCFGQWQGGLGDFMRSWLCTLAYARLYHPHVTVKLYVPDHPLKHALECLEQLPSDGLETLTLTTHHCNESEIRETLDTLANQSVVLISNLRFLECETLTSARQEFREQHLHKKPALETRLDELRQLISARHPAAFPGRVMDDDGFYCIHLRCGDRFMKGGHCDTPMMGVEEKEIFRAVEKAILFLRDQETRRPIVILSDNDDFKPLLSRKYGLITLDTQIAHLAVPDKATDQVVESTLDTVAEFFLLGESRMNVMLAYSGFVIWPSFIYDVPLYQWKNQAIVPFDYVFPY